MKRGGYSMIEVLVVLALMGILATAAVPALGAWESASASPTTEVTALLNASREAALSSGRPLTLVIDPSTGVWGAGADSHLTHRGVLQLTPAELVSDEVRIVIIFTPTGGVIGGDLEIRSDSRVTRVHVDRWTGAVGITDA